MPPSTAIGKHAYCSSLCHNDPSIIIKEEPAQTQFWSNFEITKCCDYCEYKVKVIKIYLTLSVSIQCLYAGLVQKNPLVQKTELRNG